MDTPSEDPPLVRAARWFQATPLELVGLAVLLTGALAVAVVLWWQATARPDEVPSAALEVGADAPVGQVDAPGAPDAADEVGSDEAPPGEASTGGAATGGAPPGEASGDGATADAEDRPASALTVHVTGAVATPGLVVVDGGARVGDAVAAAGGLTSAAAAELVNLARPLSDGEHVHVPRIGEGPTTAPGTGGQPRDDGPDPTPAGRLDVNAATSEQLEALPGIGPAKAGAIVRHREANGPFEVPGDLRDVPGIGEVTFQRLADLIVVG